ncbi:MAG TPA: proton-conducting transporter membrane subunit [Rectinemataceae bacterium]|nr:proton-conducting transporter membrane subunit [Rectinemataceae bacterium]
MALAMIFLPLLLAGVAALVPSNGLRPWLLPLAGLAHFAMLVSILARPDLADWSPVAGTGALLGLDPLGTIVLAVVSLLFLFASFYSVGYLHHRMDRPNRVFVAGLLGFLGFASVVAWSRHLGLSWVAIEATTLTTAPLIYFNHSKRSIEATWKYLLVGSVGIALALLGTFFLAYSALKAGLPASMDFDTLSMNAALLSKPWLRAAFILALVGYGTKMGLAPMHTWKPDAYGEAPGVVGAIFAGGVTSIAFLAFLRFYIVVGKAGEAAFASRLLLPMGLLSMAVAGVFMIGQRDFKRMLAYSSVEHMGILMIGLGVGAPALFGTMLHVVTNAMTKGVLFLSAGNIHRAFASKSTDKVRGALRRLPLSASFFLAAFFAITGSPPFGPFVSEFSIISAAFGSGYSIAAALLLAFLFVIFVGMGRTVFKVLQGRPPTAESLGGQGVYRDNVLTIAPIAMLMAIVLVLGLWIPAPLGALLRSAAFSIGGGS